MSVTSESKRYLSIDSVVRAIGTWERAKDKQTNIHIDSQNEYWYYIEKDIFNTM